MTKLLEEAIAQVKQLPESEQNKIAAMLIKQLESSSRIWEFQWRRLNWRSATSKRLPTNCR
jgi:hypothetical protein